MKKWMLLLSFSLISTIQSENNIEKSSEISGFYLGGFGGFGYANGTNDQVGIAFFTDKEVSIESLTTPLYVDAKGPYVSNSFGFGGLHFGYEWRNSAQKESMFIPALEFEGFYFAYDRTINLVNPTPSLPRHAFIDYFSMKTGTILANSVFSYENPYITPFLGIGIGSQLIWIRSADSFQIEPLEKGVNHFNGNQSGFDYAFAAQAKVGLSHTFAKHYRLYAEYRFLFTSPTTYELGPTVYPKHAPTTRWTTNFSGIYQNLFSIGIDFIW
jgi:hypothetical protein